MEVLKMVAQASLTGSILYIITYIFKPFTNKKFSATWSYYMLVLTLLFFYYTYRNFCETTRNKKL